jgi:MFS superfamily sulfate permease-like transporter
MKSLDWKNDLRASIVVFLVALPLCLGIALASNAPLISGVISGIIGGIVVGFLSGSSISVSGPAAGLTVIVASSVVGLGQFESFTLAVLLSGLLQICFGIFKGGAVGDYFPSSVIKGMLAAIGLILILKQFPHAVGYDADFMGDESFFQVDGQNTFSELFQALNAIHPGAILLAVLSFSIMIFWEKKSQKGVLFFQNVPGPLIAVVSSVIINYIFINYFPELALLEKHLVQIPLENGLSDFFASISFPNWNSLSDSKVYQVAIVLAIVASLESLLSIDAADKLDEQGGVTPKNRELIAQGIGNTISGFFGGLPLTAVIVRTSANVSAGAKSKFSAILHGLWLFTCVVTIPRFLNLIPLSSLAAMLILVGYKLTKPQMIKKIYARGSGQFVPFLATVISILLTDLLLGIIIGMIVGFIFVIRSNIKKSIVLVHEEDEYLIRFYKDVSFLQKSSLIKIFSQIPSGSSVIIDGSKSILIDDDIVDLIEDFQKRAKVMDMAVFLKKSTLALCPLFKE